jgi:RHS repeat-associated protein
MLNFFKKITLVIVSLFFAQISYALEIKTDNYNIYLGDVDGDGDGDYYFAQKPWTLILHGEIATPLLLKGTKNFVVYNNAGEYLAPQSFTMSDADLASKLAAGSLRLAVENSDVFLVNSSNGQRTLLLRGANASTAALLIKSYSNVDLPTLADIRTFSTNTYIGISDRNVQLQIVDINGDGVNDISLKNNTSLEYAYLADSNSNVINYRYFEVTPTTSAPLADATHVGTTGGQFRVDESGAATYTIPINLPEGVAGVKPQVALGYSSGGGNGIAGLGWSLSGLSAIARCRQTLSQDNNPQPITWSQTDRFCLDGQRLILISGSYGAANSTYKTEIDSVIEVKAIGGTTGHPEKFEVKAKDGSVSTYGGTSDSKLVGSTTSNSTLTWAINRFEDNMKNAIEYAYENDAAGQRIKNIYYAYNSISTSTRGASGAQAKVEFNYILRSDVSSSYVSGFKFSQESLLENIKVYNTNSSNVMELLRSYNLGYMSSTIVASRYDSSLVNRLISVQECRGSACYLPLTFEWGGGTHLSFNYPQALGNESSGYVGSPQFGDYDGDGKSDFVYIYIKPDGKSYIKTTYSGSRKNLEPAFYLATNKVVKILNIDYNMDGRMDLAYYNGSTWNIALATVNGDKQWFLNFASIADTIVLPQDVNQFKEKIAFADINSDGAADVLYGQKFRLLLRNTEPMSSNKAYSFSESKMFSLDENSMPVNQTIAAPYGYSHCDPIDSYDGVEIVGNTLGDFNGDGRVDFIGKVNTSAQCYYSTGYDVNQVYVSGFYTFTVSGDITNPQARMYSLLSSPTDGNVLGTYQTVDINGDGLTDLVKEQWSGNDLSLKAQINNGNGFDAVFEWYKLTSYTKDRSPQLIDVNADGLLDIVTTDKNLNVIFTKYQKNSQGNWVYSTTSPSLRSSSSYNDASQSLMDLSGDGVLDNIMFRPSEVKVSYGVKSISGTTVPCRWVPTPIGSQCVGGVTDPSIAVPSTQQQDAIYQFNSGTGNFTKVAYGTLSNSGRYEPLTVGIKTTSVCPYPENDNPYFCLGGNVLVDASEFYTAINSASYDFNGNPAPLLEVNGPMSVVISAESSAPTAGAQPYQVISGTTNKVDYYYGEAKMQASGRGFLGFQFLRTVDAQTNISTVTKYSQKFPLIGSPIETKSYSSSGRLLSWSTNQWDFKPLGVSGAKYYLPYLKQSIERKYSPEEPLLGYIDLPLQTIVTNNTYDNFANLTNVSTITTGENISLTQTVVNEYGSPGVTDFNNLYGRLTKATVTTQRNTEASKTKVSTFTYELSGNKQGLLKTETIEGGSTTTYQYDDFGNKTTVSVTAKNSLGVNETRNTFNTYSTDGRYLVSTRNDLSQSAQITARNEYGQAVSATDANGIPSGTTYYDAMGNQYMQKNADGSWSRTESRWCNGATGIACPTGAVYRTRSRASGGSEAIEYFDILGRSTRSSKRHFDGQWSNVDTEYDNLSRVKRQSVPFISSSSTSGQATAWTTTEFDNYGRPTKVKAPDNSESTMVYNGNTTTSINAKGQKKYETKNGLGQLVKVQDELGGVIEYEYDVYGGLLKATTKAVDVSQPFSVRMCYDNLGRKTAMLDPDKGGTRAAANDATIDCGLVGYQRAGWWTYKYNGFGELVEQADPKGQRTQMHYDKLGRMVGRVDVLANGSIESFTQWFYEKGVNAQATGINGKLTAVVMDSSPGLTTTQINNALTSGVATCSQTSSSCHKTINEFDVLTRPTVTKTYYPGSATEYVSRVDYDSFGRAYKQYDALDNQLTENGNKIASGTQSSYNDFGYVQSVRDLSSGQVLSTVIEMNARGQLKRELRGNVVNVENTYNDLTGLLTNQQAGIGAVWSIQNLSYQWDVIGNLQYRKNNSPFIGGTGNKNKQESFCYDALNRLIKTVAGLATTTPDCASQDMVYDGFGNIKNKNGVAYEYSNANAGPHAVTKAGNATYTYDANGNAILGDGRNFEYTSYDMASKITKGSDYVEFKYGPDRARWKRTDKKGSSTTHTTYIGNIERIETLGTNTIEWKRYVGGAIFTYKTNMSNQVQNTDKAYVYNDHLGSVDVITNAVGTIVNRQSMSFDAWGSRRGGEDWSNWSSLSDSERATAITNALAVPNFSRPITTRGYTGHEMVDDMGIIHMNGRIYDAKLGRFLQADPFIQAATDTQSYNRYSYVRNNPLNATDPSGYFSNPLKKLGRSLIRGAVKIFGADVVNFVGSAVSSYFGGAIGAAAWTYEFSRAMGASSSQAFRAAATSYASAQIFTAIGKGFTGDIKVDGFWSWSAQGGAGHIAAHAFVGGVLSEIQGGKFGHGFASAGLTKAFMHHSGFDYSDGSAPAVIGRTIIAGVVGGTISELTGGKFVNGAITAAMAHLFNQEATEKQKRDILEIEKKKIEVGVKRSLARLSGTGKLSYDIDTGEIGASSEIGFDSPLSFSIDNEGKVTMVGGAAGIKIDAINKSLEGLVVDMLPGTLTLSGTNPDVIEFEFSLSTGAVGASATISGKFNITNFIRNEIKFMDSYIERTDYYKSISCQQHPEIFGSCN